MTITRKIYILLLISGFCMTLTQAQNIRGTIRSTDGNPVSHATIGALNNPNGAVSDSAGNYRLNMPGGIWQLYAECIGYARILKTVTVSTDSVIIVDFVLVSVMQQLDEIVITPEKREVRLVDTDLSVSVLNAARIQETGTRTLSDLSGLIPNYQYSDAGVGYQQQIALRGVTVFSNNPSTATYIDGVNAFDITANGFQLMDIERIEILRGPQGTLYGRNAMGGVINIITRKPANSTSGFVETSIGNQGLQRYGGAFRTPLVNDRLFLGVAGQFQHQHGFYGNQLSPDFTYFGHTFTGPADTSGIRFGDANTVYTNIYLRWLAGKSLDLTANFKIQKDYSVGPSSYFGAAETDSVARQQPYKFSVNRFGTDSRTVSNTSLAARYKHRYFNLLSVSAWQYVQTSFDNIDFDYWTFDVAYASSYNKKTGGTVPMHVLSQELKLSSPERVKRLQWTAGTYLFHQWFDYATATTYIVPLADLFGYRGTDVSENIQRNAGIAFFGQATWQVLKRLYLTGGLRYDYEYRQSSISAFNIADDGSKTVSIADTARYAAFNALSPKIVVSYRPGARQNIYASYTRGFRAGGINTVTRFEGYENFLPEYSDNYELGYKHNLNNRIQVAATLFYLSWKDLQLDFRPDGISYITANLGNVRSKGLELELSAIPLKNLQADIALGINDARYHQFTYPESDQQFSYLGEDISGNRTIMSPRSTLFAGIQYNLPVTKKARLVFRGEWRRTGQQYFDLMNRIDQPAYNLFNVRTGLVLPYGELFLWVRNITDTRYLAYAFPAIFRYSLLNRPRTFGATLTIKF